MKAQTANKGYSIQNNYLITINKPITLWTSIIDANNCEKMCLTSDRSIVTLAAMGSGDSYSVIKYDMNGIQKWSTLFGSKTNGEETTPIYLNSILVSQEEGISVSGYAGASPTKGGSVVVGYSCLLGDNGEIKSIRNRAKDKKDAFFEGYDIPYIKTKIGNYAVMRGQSLTIGTTNNIEVYLRFINNEGKVYSEKIIDTIKDVEDLVFPTFQQTSDGGYLGYFYSIKNNTPKEWHAVKLDKDGTVQWSQVWKENSYGFKGGCVALELSDGSVLTANNTIGTPIGYAHIRQFSATGELLMHKKISAKSQTIIYSLAETKDHKIILGGTTLDVDSTDKSFPNYRKDFFLTQMNMDSDVEWQSVWGTESKADQISQVAVADDGSLIIGGIGGETGTAFVSKILPNVSSIFEGKQEENTCNLTITENGTTYNATYTLSRNSSVSLSVYNLLGTKILSILHNMEQSSGTYNLPLPISQLPTGQYFIRCTDGKTSITKPLTIVR
jgi:hypothetical protein